MVLSFERPLTVSSVPTYFSIASTSQPMSVLAAASNSVPTSTTNFAQHSFRARVAINLFANSTCSSSPITPTTSTTKKNDAAVSTMVVMAIASVVTLVLAAWMQG